MFEFQSREGFVEVYIDNQCLIVIIYLGPEGFNEDPTIWLDGARPSRNCQII